jgi:hypothetical protein
MRDCRRLVVAASLLMPAALATALAACSNSSPSGGGGGPDGGRADSSSSFDGTMPQEAGPDAPIDTSAPDAPEASPPDAGADTGTADSAFDGTAVEASSDAADSGAVVDGAEGGGPDDSEPPDTGPADGGPGDTGSVDAGVDAAEAGLDTGTPGDGGACNNLTMTAPPITVVAGTGTVPAGQGGTVVAGTYFLTGYVIYSGGPTQLIGVSIAQEFQLVATSTGFDVHSVINNNEHEDDTLVVSGTSYTSTVTCPAGLPPTTAQYTVDSVAKTVTLYPDNQGVTYTLQ